MKIFKSIKWRLQIWYGLILVAVLTGFGLTAYHLESNRQFRRIDDELHRRFGFLVNALHRPPPRELEGDGPPFDRPPPRRNDDFENEPQPFARDSSNPRVPVQFHLPPEAAGLFDASDPNGFYYVITRGEVEIARSTNAPSADRYGYFLPGIMNENAMPVLPPKYSPQKYNGDFTMETAGPPTPVGQPQPATMHGTFREVMNLTSVSDMRSATFILVGRNVAPELKELRYIALTLTAVGAGILLLGLTVGGRLVSRALQPIEAISATAMKISAGDLSQRINIAEVESELGQLAAVLNSTFARLENAFAQQKQFAADAAHELRTPVSVMLTQTQTALNRERDAAGYKQTVEACQRAAQRMRKLIESLLALARFDAGQEVLNRLPFDLSKAVADGVELVQPLAEERGVKIFVESEPLPITGDSERLAQVVTNLLTNAIQYNQPKGEVRVKLESQTGLAVLTVADTGQGIAAENLPRVFGRFFRADPSRTGAGNAGLGLAISKAIVEAHGGTIEVASEINAGTIFTVRLPISR
jgi:heavy metal sensor kinase